MRTTKLHVYLKGRTGDLLRREEPHKAISRNTITDQDYLGNGFRGTKFGYGCRTRTPTSSFTHQLNERSLWVFTRVSLGHGLVSFPCAWVCLTLSVGMCTGSTLCTCTNTSVIYAGPATSWTCKWEWQQTDSQEKSPELESPLD